MDKLKQLVKNAYLDANNNAIKSNDAISTSLNWQEFWHENESKFKNLALSGVSNSVCPSEYCQSKQQKVCNGYCFHKSETPPIAN